MGSIVDELVGIGKMLAVTEPGTLSASDERRIQAVKDRAHKMNFTSTEIDHFINEGMNMAHTNHRTFF